MVVDPSKTGARALHAPIVAGSSPATEPLCPARCWDRRLPDWNPEAANRGDWSTGDVQNVVRVRTESSLCVDLRLSRNVTEALYRRADKVIGADLDQWRLLDLVVQRSHRTHDLLGQ